MMTLYYSLDMCTKIAAKFCELGPIYRTYNNNYILYNARIHIIMIS